MKPNPKELVVCRYGEGRNLDWIKGVQYPVHVYNKGPDDVLFSDASVPMEPAFPPYTVHDCPNVSYEDYVMLRHILDRWDKLADVTVFCQDDAPTERHGGDHFLAVVNDIPEDLGETRPLFCNSGSGLHSGLLTCDAMGSTNPECPVREVYEELFGLNWPGSVEFMASSLLAVPRSVIHGRPRIFYSRAAHILEREFERMCITHREICTWTFERLWLRIFNQRRADA
jgi:hypothetical protein